MNEYHFKVPGWMIWIFHIVFGMFLTYVGYQVLNNKPVHEFIALALIVIGVMAMTYHAHIWFVNT